MAERGQPGGVLVMTGTPWAHSWSTAADTYFEFHSATALTTRPRGLPEWGGPPVTGERAQQVIGADLVRDQRSGNAEHVRPLGVDLLPVDLVAGDCFQRPVRRR